MNKKITALAFAGFATLAIYAALALRSRAVWLGFTYAIMVVFFWPVLAMIVLGVADALFGRINPSGKLPVTVPFAGKGFLDQVKAEQFPGVLSPDGKLQTVTYSEQLAIGHDVLERRLCAWKNLVHRVAPKKYQSGATILRNCIRSFS